MPPLPASHNDIEDKLYTEDFAHFMSDAEIYEQAKNFWANHRFDGICCDCESDACSYQNKAYNSVTTELFIHVKCQNGKDYFVQLNRNPDKLFFCNTLRHFKDNRFSVSSEFGCPIAGSILLSSNPTALSEIEIRFWWWVAQLYADIPEWMVKFGLDEEEEPEPQPQHTQVQPQASTFGDFTAGDGTRALSVFPKEETYVSPFDGSEK